MLANTQLNNTMRFFFILLATIFLITSTAPSRAVVEQEVIFDNQKTEKRYKSLIAELRCLVCQNQNLADSDAELAKDLRRKTVEMLKNGASDNDVRTYMSDRYGDFILYKPPFNITTAFLWLGPIILLFCVLFGIVLNLRKRQQDALLKRTQANSDQTRVKVQNLLKNTPTLDSKSNSEQKESKPNT